MASPSLALILDLPTHGSLPARTGWLRQARAIGLTRHLFIYSLTIPNGSTLS